MRRTLISTAVIALAVMVAASAFANKQVAIYTGTTQWIAKAPADEQAKICVDELTKAGIKVTWLSKDTDMKALADWTKSVTNDKGLDVLVLYGDVPPDLYPEKNAKPDGSVVETFIESTDGDAVINHADYMFWGLNGRNEEGGIKNVMDIPDIVMWDDNTALTITDDGKKISPTLASMAKLESDRPFHLDQLKGEWKAEAILAKNAAGTRADPVIVRDGNRGRLIPCIQTADGPEPKGKIASEIIKYLWSTTTAVEPSGKASMTWGSLKATR